MKVIKVEGGKHYVIGGPVCQSCKGTGWFDYNAGAPKMPCHDCYGTGFQAVEGWSNDRKEEWLRENAPTKIKGLYRKNWSIHPEELRIRVDVFTSCYEWEVVYISHDRDGDEEAIVAENKDKSLALTAAVINVAKEEK